MKSNYVKMFFFPSFHLTYFFHFSKDLTCLQAMNMAQILVIWIHFNSPCTTWFTKQWYGKNSYLFFWDVYIVYVAQLICTQRVECGSTIYLLGIRSKTETDSLSKMFYMPSSVTPFKYRYFVLLFHLIRGFFFWYLFRVLCCSSSQKM